MSARAKARTKIRKLEEITSINIYNIGLGKQW